MKLKAIFILALLAVLLTACNKESSDAPRNLQEQLVGQWLTSEKDGNQIPTNNKKVINFISPTLAHVSASIEDYDESIPDWHLGKECEVIIEGNTVDIVSHPSENVTVVMEMNIQSINNREMYADCKQEKIQDGESRESEKFTLKFKRFNEDFSKDVLGMWEGRVSSQDPSEYDDGKLHRWEYKEDGTYVYYSLDANGNWTSGGSNDELSIFYCDGPLLCSRWKGAGAEEEFHEWWEILSIKVGVMKWYAIRQRKDGSSYITSFYMTKVRR